MICIATLLLFDFDLASGDGGLLSSDPLPQWEYGVATTGPAIGAVWGTRLGGDYFNDATAVLEIPLPDVSGATRPVLVVEHWYALGAGDRAVLDLDTGGGAVPVEPIGGFPSGVGWTGASGGWQRFGIDLQSVPAGSRVRLRLDADSAGRDAGWYVRSVRVEDGDPIPPSVAITSAPSDTQELDNPYGVEVRVEEDFNLTRVDLVWSGATSGRAAMQWVSGDLWRGAIDAQPPGTDVSWSVEAADCGNTFTAPGEDFRVFLAAPEDFVGPLQPHIVARSVTLSWSPPLSPHTPDAYEIEAVATGQVYGPVADTSADVPLSPGEDQSFVVRGIYPEGVGDPSVQLDLEVEVPELLSVSPAAVFPGDRVYVEVQGRSLYLLDGVSSMVLGDPSVSVESFKVRDVNRGVALVEVDPSAPPGMRQVLLTGVQGTFGFDERFEVLDSANAPRILSVQPGSVVQGEEVEVEVIASQRFAGPVTITTDEELIAGGEPVVDGDRVRFRIAATGRARSGRHDVILDDGQRLWSVAIEVDEFIFDTSPGTCSVAGEGMGFWLLPTGWRRR